ncbi:hypothetical protein EON65_30080, partial [archaeon]
AAVPPFGSFIPPPSPGSLHTSNQSASQTSNTHLNPQAQEFVPSFLSR